MSLQYLEHNPLRPVDWRWQRATSIYEGVGLTTTRRRDRPQGYKWIRRAIRFKQRYEQSDAPARREQLAEDMHDVFWAHWVYTSGNPMRHSIEAHILARESNFEVGFRCGIAPAVVDAYEALFFNVREKLQHQKYILHCVLGDALQLGFQERDYNVLWKLYGYYLGPNVLDALENKFSAVNWCGTPEGVNSALQDDAISTLKMKAALAAKTVQVNGYTQLALLEQFTKFVEVERSTDSSGKAQEQILENIQAMMTALPFNVGGEDPRNQRSKVHRGSLEVYDKSAVELTYEETMRVAVRKPIANAETLRELSFPVTLTTQQDIEAKF